MIVGCGWGRSRIFIFFLNIFLQVGLISLETS